jgi:hypothetical protein
MSYISKLFFAGLVGGACAIFDVVLLQPIVLLIHIGEFGAIGGLATMIWLRND